MAIMCDLCARVCLIEISKALDMHLFLFDDILLLTRVKKGSRKVGEANACVLLGCRPRSVATGWIGADISTPLCQRELR